MTTFSFSSIFNFCAFSSYSMFGNFNSFVFFMFKKQGCLDLRGPTS